MSQDAEAPGPARAEVEHAPDTVAESLTGLADLPVEEHVARFAAVHDRLRARLEGQDSPAAGTGAGA
jgi:hypothetical protein